VVVAAPSTKPLPLSARAEDDKASGNERVDWSLLVPRLVNPIKVLIIESMLWIERPLSATELEKLSGGQPILNSIWYHLESLADLGILEIVEKRKMRKSQGSTKETFFFFAVRQQR